MLLMDMALHLLFEFNLRLYGWCAMTTKLLIDRELLERAWRALANSATGREIGAYLDADPCAPECAETCARASMCSTCSALLSAPSPAVVDGLEVVGWYRMDDRKAITPYPSVCATWHKMGVKVGAAYSDSAQAIIDGLRGEVERLQRAEKNDAIAYKAAIERQGELRTERDQQAQRIGELERALLEVAASLAWNAHGECRAIHDGPIMPSQMALDAAKAALSAGKDSDQ